MCITRGDDRSPFYLFFLWVPGVGVFSWISVLFPGEAIFFIVILLYHILHDSCISHSNRNFSFVLIGLTFFFWYRYSIDV